MHLIRRSALRAASASASASPLATRSINTSTPFILRTKTQSAIIPSAFRRYSDDAEKSHIPSADGEHSAVNAAIESASDAGAAAGGFSGGYERREPRQYDDRRGGGGDRGGQRGGYGGNGGGRSFGGDRGGRGGYGGAPQRGGDRGGYGNDVRGGGGRGGFAERPPPKPSASIYVGNLLFDITAADIEKEFQEFGTIKNTIIAADNRGLSKGFAYVEFESIEQAAAAIEAKHQSVLEGRRLIVNYMNQSTRNPSQTNTENEPSKTLFIGNLAFEMSDADLNKLFRDIRNVVDVRVAIDRRTGQPRGFAHADFVDVESAIKGKEALMGKEVYGRTLRLDFSAGSREPRGDGGLPREPRGDSSY